MARRAIRRLVVIAGSVALLGGACGSDSDDAAAVEKTVRAAVAAENAKDATTFLKFWTDKGLEANGEGTRAEIKSGKSEDFGADKFSLTQVVKTTVKNNKKAASIVVDATPDEAPVAQIVYRLQLDLIKRNGDWLINNLTFKGSPPATGEVVDITAQEYAFGLSKTSVGGDVAFSFKNVGKEQHELTVFKAPDGTTLEAALAAVKDVNGETLEGAPATYKVDHFSFTEPGETVAVSFYKPLTKGTYVFACYIPQGGFGDEGPINPEGKPHVQLGMINLLTVT